MSTKLNIFAHLAVVDILRTASTLGDQEHTTVDVLFRPWEATNERNTTMCASVISVMQAACKCVG